MALLEYEEHLNKNDFYSMDEIVKLYGPSYMINFENTLIIKNEELFERYLTEDIIDVKVNGEVSKVSKSLIMDLINDTGMRHYLFENLDNRLSIGVRIAYIGEDSIPRYIKVSRAVLDQALRMMKKESDESIIMHIAMIHSFTNSQSFKNKYGQTDESREENYMCVIDDQDIVIPYKTLSEIFVANNIDEFKRLIEHNIHGYSKEVMAYALIDFIEKERILQKYNFDDKIIARYNDLKQLKIYNFESLNKNSKTNTLKIDGTDILDGIIIPDYLNSLIEDSLKNGCSKLETALLCYMELCDTLKYDENYLITKIKDDESPFTPTEEFVYIMAKILKKLDIKFTINQSVLVGDTKGFENLTFKYGEYLVSIDSLDDISKSDLKSVKIGDKLLCIKSINSVKVSRDKFNELLDKIYKDYLLRQKRELDFEANVDKYRSTYFSFNVSKDEKIKILLKAIARKDLMGLDTITYITRIFKRIFGEKDGITVTFIGNSELGKGYKPTPITIVTVETDNGYIYFEVNPYNKKDNIVKPIEKQELVELFNMGWYYFMNNESDIPGLEKKHEYVRSS